MGYVHYCVFCGHNSPADTATMLQPSCPRCGCARRACEEAEFPRIAAALADQRSPRRPRFDGAGPLAALIVGPFLLPMVGVEVSDVIFAVPFVFLFFAAALCFAAARREGEPSRAWRAYGVSAGLATAATAVGIGLHVAGAGLRPAYYAGSLASFALVAAIGLHVHDRAKLGRFRDRASVGQMLVLVLTASVYFVAVPSIAGGDAILTLTFLLDLVAVVLAGLLIGVGRRSQDARIAKRIWAAALAILVADGLVAAGAAGLVSSPDEVSACFLAIAGWLLAGAATAERPAPTPEQAREEVAGEWSWLAGRVVVPTLQVLALPAMLAVALVVDGVSAWPLVWFGAGLVTMLMLAFGRQAFLVVDHRRAVIEERLVRRKAQRRNEELEALTGLATTMTQTLEEAPIVEQALTVLHTAARATSSALHVRDDSGRRRLRASAGDWQSEHPWTDRASGVDGEVERYVRGGRQVTRLALHARGHHIGWVTLVRPATDPLGDRELDLLSLLVDQMAIAVQNARDYREKLEQAVRDPLTGIYNRRYFFEALEKEVQRSKRYGSHAGLVLLDVDDFKRINDTGGHAAGDEVLRGIANVVAPLLRPVDSFARIGGEEFALLLPETKQMDALLVAERLRAAISRSELLPGLKVTVSAGVGSCPVDAPTREELLRRTDGALYWAKRNGKDLCAVVNEVTDGITPDADRDAATAAANLATLVTAIDAEHLYTADHSTNVALYAVALGQAIGMDSEHLVRLRRAALLHDIGKVAVRPSVLEKPNRLSDEEFSEIKLHSNVGAAMLHHAGLQAESRWVRHHHERFDGTGYPEGIAGEGIPLESRIIFVADSFEAMTSNRPYRSGMSVEDAMKELERCAGSQFEPRLVKAFCKLVKKGALEVMALRSASQP